jgi:hypothetical protein
MQLAQLQTMQKRPDRNWVKPAKKGVQSPRSPKGVVRTTILNLIPFETEDGKTSITRQELLSITGYGTGKLGYHLGNFKNEQITNNIITRDGRMPTLHISRKVV